MELELGSSTSNCVLLPIPPPENQILQLLVFSVVYPSIYWPDPTLLHFGDRRRTAVST